MGKSNQFNAKSKHSDISHFIKKKAEGMILGSSRKAECTCTAVGISAISDVII